MSGELRVDTARVRDWAAAQEAAAKEIAAAAGLADGTSESMWVRHGVICSPSNIATWLAEEARKRACDVMEKDSASLCHNLGSAAQQYDEVDQHSAGKINGRMRPGGR